MGPTTLATRNGRRYAICSKTFSISSWGRFHAFKVEIPHALQDFMAYKSSENDVKVLRVENSLGPGGHFSVISCRYWIKREFIPLGVSEITRIVRSSLVNFDPARRQ